ncbi:hypothetical protein BS78_06G014200 [Paspalum vaginatum]|nr:hypothetical protein BS78_06G014200 [Paspalum vaginatum]
MMAVDTNLILDALNYHFDQTDAKIDRWFSSGALRGQAACGLPAVAAVASPSSSPPSSSLAAAATTTSRDTIVVASSTEHTTTHHIVAADDATCVMSTRCSTQVSTSTPITASASLPTTGVAAHAAVLTCPSVPDAHVAEKEIQTNSPKSCSTKCFSREIDVLKPVDIVTAVWNAPLTLLHFMADIPQDNKDWALEHSQRRFITIPTPSLSNRVALLCDSARVHKAPEVFEGMSAHTPLQLQLLPTTVAAIRPWPPPQQNASILSFETIRICFSFEPSLGSIWVTMQQRPPWPPPTQCDMLSDSVQLRPTPWPCIGCHGAFMKLERFRSPVISCLDRKDRKGYKSPNEWHVNACSVHGACQFLSLGWSLDLDLKLMVSQHTLQGILVMNANGFPKTMMANCVLQIHCDFLDMMLHKSTINSWSDVYCLLFTCHQETVQYTLSWPWVSLMCMNIHSCYFSCTISTWQPAPFTMIGWPQNTKLLFFDDLCNHFKMNQTVAPIVCSSYEPVTLWEIPWPSPTLVCFKTVLLAEFTDVALKLLLKYLLTSTHEWLWCYVYAVHEMQHWAFLDAMISASRIGLSVVLQLVKCISIYILFLDCICLMGHYLTKV